MDGPWTPQRFGSLALRVMGAGILLRCIWDFAAKGRGTLAPVDVVLYEEPSLQRRLGDSYERYFRSVPRWLPTRRHG